MDNRERQIRAQRQVRSIEAFYIHAAIFVAVNLILLAVNLEDGGPLWVLWVFAGWGIGLAGHAYAVFGHHSRRITRWRVRKIEQLARSR